MKIINGQKVQLQEEELLLKIFRKRNFFLNDENRIRFAKKLSLANGTVESVEEKYAHDFFYFLPNGENSGYSVPTESIKI